MQAGLIWISTRRQAYLHNPTLGIHAIIPPKILEKESFLYCIACSDRSPALVALELAALLHVAANDLRRSLGRIDQMKKIQVACCDAPMGQHLCPDPVEQPLPVTGPEQHDGKLTNFFGLDQGQGFEELIHGAETARKNNIGHGVADEHQLADEKITEGDTAVLKKIGMLFPGQNDIEPDQLSLSEFGLVSSG